LHAMLAKAKPTRHLAPLLPKCHTGLLSNNFVKKNSKLLFHSLQPVQPSGLQGPGFQKHSVKELKNLKSVFSKCLLFFCCCCAASASSPSHKCCVTWTCPWMRLKFQLIFLAGPPSVHWKLESPRLYIHRGPSVLCPPQHDQKSVVKLQPSQSPCQTLFQTPECNPVQHTMHFALISDSNGGPRPQPQQLQPQPLSRCSRLLSTCADKHISPFDGIVD
jgi:hypothetical protein